MTTMEQWLESHRGTATWCLFAVTLALLVLTLDDPGITWDEPGYFGSAQLQVEWVRMLLTEPATALDRETVFQMWDWDHYHNPHPPIYKEAMALTWWATKGLIGQLAGYRLAPALLFSALIAIAFQWGARAWGAMGGLGAALSILLMPRLFGHAHIGATETPLITFWVAASAAIWWGVERKSRLAWALAGVALGLAAGTKFTGVLAVMPPAAWAVWRDRRATLHGLPIAVGIAIVVFWVLNPMLWFDPGRFFGVWIWESLHRGDYAPISTYYLGEVYTFSLPWHHVFVMTAAVTPLGILVLAGLGGYWGLRRLDPLVLLCAGSVAFVWVLMLLPGAPHHNGVRMFIALFPFMGMLSGYGLHRAWQAIAGRAREALLAIVFLPAALQLAWIHPLELSYYGEIVGSVRGADRLGLETTYWMDACTEPVLEWMNRELPPGAKVWVFGNEITLVFQQAYGRLRKDIELRSEGPGSEWALVVLWRGVMSPEFVAELENTRPAYALELQGVPLVAIYRIARSTSAPEDAPQ